MRSNRCWTLLLAVAVATAPGVALAADAPIDFRRDVIPALTKSGCNAGACHGSFQGRGGFTLSLLGFNPLADYEAIVQQSRGRRVSPSSPEQSLLLLKPIGAVPHGGGKRLSPDMPAYRILRDWLAQGMRAPREDDPQIIGLETMPAEVVLNPGEQASPRVTARWSDGSARDVTAWALYDSRDPTANTVNSGGTITALKSGTSPVSVRYLGQVASVAVRTPYGEPKTIDFPANNYIDDLVRAEWERLGVAPAPLSSDSEFLRRVYLDLIGTLPQLDEARRFLDSTDSDKRRRLIDELLDRPEYVDYWTLKWADLLRAHRRYVGTKGLNSLTGWLRRCVRENRPLDRMARELLTAQGNLFTNGPVAYFFVDQSPEELAETTAQLFLGVRMQCARCHHHPFETWGQDDYHGLAAFFTKLEVRENGESGRFGGMRTLRPVEHVARKPQVTAPPRLPGVNAPVPESDDIRRNLADWIVGKDNPYFARNFANRFWAYLIGRGLVEPIDDMRATNPSVNSALLDALAKDFTDHDFDVKRLLRTICNSRTYQLASEIAPQRDLVGALFTHRVPRRLPAEVLLDAINQATGYTEQFVGTPLGTRAIALPDPTVPSSFLAAFGRPQRNSPCECARDSSPDLLQALHLVNNGAIHQRTVHAQGRVARLISQEHSDAEIAEELYLTTLSRKPTDHELQTINELLAEAPSRREGWEDLMWTLLNCPEFAFNH